MRRALTMGPSAVAVVSKPTAIETGDAASIKALVAPICTAAPVGLTVMRTHCQPAIAATTGCTEPRTSAPAVRDASVHTLAVPPNEQRTPTPLVHTSPAVVAPSPSDTPIS